MFRILSILSLLAWGGLAQAAPPQAYKAARIWTGSGPPIVDGVMLVRDGKIVAVGTRDQVVIPEEAQVHDLGSAVLIPGLVIAETSLGERGRDDERALTPEFLALDSFDFYADYSTALSGGVTTIQIAPGNRRLMPGQGAVVKLAGDDPTARTLRERESLRILLGEAFRNPPRIFEPPVGAVSVERPLQPTRQQLAASLASAVAGLRATFRAASLYSQPANGPKEKEPALAAIAEHIKGNGLLRFSAPGAADIRAALALGREFHQRLLLVDSTALDSFQEQLSSWRDIVAGVVLNAEIRPGAIADVPVPDKENPKRRLPWENARQLLSAGLKVAIKPASDSDLDDMLFVAGLFTSGGLSAEQVLAMLTTTPADLLGVGDRVGTLAAGKDADFVVLSGDPFALHTRVRSVYVNGKSAYTAKTAVKSTVLQASRIYTGNGEILQRGSVLVEGSKIRGLGRDISIPSDAIVRRYDRGVIVPGFVDLSTGLGLGGPLNSPVSLQTNLGGQLLTSDPAVALARQGGVTTVLLASTNPSPSPVLAFKLGDKPRVVQEPVAIHFGISGNLTSQATTLRSSLQFGKAYADSWTRYEAAFADYEKKKQEYDIKMKAAAAANAAEGDEEQSQKPDPKAEPKKEQPKPAAPTAPEKPRVIDALEPYRALFAGKIPALVEAHRTDAIKLAAQVFRDEFKVRTVLMGADDAFRLVDLLAQKEIAVAVGPQVVRFIDNEAVNLPQILANRGVSFGFQSRATAGVKTLPLAVQYAVRQGLGSDDALAGLTVSPAKLLNIDRQIGSLATGKDADLVVLSGPPFELSTRVLAVMIDGQIVYEE